MPRLTPTEGPLYVVRWLRADGSCTKHRYFRRHHDAVRLLTRLLDGGWTADLYATETRWRHVDRGPFGRRHL